MDLRPPYPSIGDPERKKGPILAVRVSKWNLGIHVWWDTVEQE